MQVDAQRLQREYERLVDGLAAAGVLRDAQRGDLANPVLPQDILNEAVPGNIRRSAPPRPARTPAPACMPPARRRNTACTPTLAPRMPCRHRSLVSAEWHCDASVLAPLRVVTLRQACDLALCWRLRWPYRGRVA